MKITRKQIRKIITEVRMVQGGGMPVKSRANSEFAAIIKGQRKLNTEAGGPSWSAVDDEWYEDRHAEDQNDMGYYIAVALEKAVKSNPGIDGAGLLNVVRQDPEYSSLFKGVSDNEVWDVADETIEEGTLFFDVEEDAWYYAPEFR